MLNIRRPLGPLIFNMGIAIPVKTVFLIETAPRLLQSEECQMEVGNYLDYHWSRFLIYFIMTGLLRKITGWHHEMWTLSTLLALCEGNHWSLVDSLPKEPVMQSFDVSFDVSQHKCLNKQLQGRWIKMSWWSFDIVVMITGNFENCHSETLLQVEK